MPYLSLEPGCTLHYLDDDYTRPWESHEVAVLVHGVAEHRGVWFEWMPHLAPHSRLIHLDLRGFGASSVHRQNTPSPSLALPTTCGAFWSSSSCPPCTSSVPNWGVRSVCNWPSPRPICCAA